MFLEQSAAGAWREAPGTAVSRAQLGFHDWEAGPDYARLSGGELREGARFLSFKALKVPDGGLEESEGSRDEFAL